MPCWTVRDQPSQPPPELIEMAYARAVGDAVRRAYQRSDKINHRREMMEAWAKYAMHGAADAPSEYLYGEAVREGSKL